MDTEQLRMILDAMAGMGEAGKEAFIAWLMFTNLTAPIAWIIIVTVVCVAVYKVIRSERDRVIAANEERQRENMVYTRLREIVRAHLRRRRWCYAYLSVGGHEGPRYDDEAP